MFVRQPQFRNARADVQMFYGVASQSQASRPDQQLMTWNKPPGVSHVYMLLIGRGGHGNQADSGGGSGGVTVWYGAAQNVPDSLFLRVGNSTGVDTSVYARATDSNTNFLLRAGAAGSAPFGGAAMTANSFAASGFFQSVAGQNGSAGGAINPSSTTFLSGGAPTAADAVTANYGYGVTSGASRDGFFMLQPIIVGCGANGGGTAGIGCGGGIVGLGGPGMALIASW